MRIRGLAAVFCFHLHILIFFFSLGRRPDGSEGERELSETFVGPTKCNEPVLSFSGNPRMKFPLSTEGVVRMRACGGMAAFFFFALFVTAISASWGRVPSGT